MGLTKDRDTLKVLNSDPVQAMLGEKIEGGNGIAVRVDKSNNPKGYRVVIEGCKTMGGDGEVITIDQTYYNIPSNTTMAFIKADNARVEATLPDPAEARGWLSLVAIDTSCPIEIKGNVFARREDTHYFNAPGDAVILASNRVDTWYVIAKYNQDFYY